MKLLGLIGRPLSHSFSKNYFSEKFEQENILHYQYHLYPLETIDELRGLLKNNPELVGLNVTIPYKQEVIPFLDELTDVVAEANACNCIKIIDGKLIGYNTDVIGIEKTLSSFLKPLHTDALILGTGGASNAVQYVFKKAGINFQVVSRTPSEKEIAYSHITKMDMGKNKLIINCTPVGMYPLVDNAPDIDYDAIGPDHILFDLIYNPPKTLFLQRGEERGAVIINGMNLLKIQADESWRIWND